MASRAQTLQRGVFCYHKYMIITLNDLNSIRTRHANQKLVLTSGTFDLLHVGHLNYLEQVKQYGDRVIVLLSGDNRVKSRKGPSHPIINEVDRARILDSLKVVDYVFIDPSRLKPNETDPIHAEILQELQPDHYVTDGPDPRFVDLMDKAKFIILERLQSEPSTTSIIERIKALISSE
jgi:cytidyltransferase-like protein